MALAAPGRSSGSSDGCSIPPRPEAEGKPFAQRRAWEHSPSLSSNSPQSISWGEGKNAKGVDSGARAPKTLRAPSPAQPGALAALPTPRARAQRQRTSASISESARQPDPAQSSPRALAVHNSPPAQPPGEGGFLGPGPPAAGRGPGTGRTGSLCPTRPHQTSRLGSAQIRLLEWSLARDSDSESEDLEMFNGALPSGSDDDAAPVRRGLGGPPAPAVVLRPGPCRAGRVTVPSGREVTVTMTQAWHDPGPPGYRL